MKHVLILLLLAFSFQLDAQKSLKYDGPRAKTKAEFTEMLRAANVNVVRTHQQFVDRVKEDKGLRAIFKNRTQLEAFLKDLTFAGDAIASFKFGSLKKDYPDKYKEYTDYILGHFGVGELFDKNSSTSASATHLEGYCCSCPDCVACNGGACIFSICADHCSKSYTSGKDMDFNSMLRGF
jgi:hypothetical protein